MKKIVFFLILCMLSAPGFAAELSIDLRTDYEQSADFKTIRISVLDEKNERNQWMVYFTRDGDFSSGVRIADFDELKSERNYMVSTELLDDRMRTVDGSLTRLSLESGRNGMTVLISMP